MQEMKGTTVYKGIALGKIKVFKRDTQVVSRIRKEDSAAESRRFEEARQTAIQQLQTLHRKAVKEVGETSAAIFEIHQMMLDDEDYLNAVRSILETEHINAEYAVTTAGRNFAEMFSSMDDEYMKARAADIKDISERLVRVLQGGSFDTEDDEEPHIIFAEDLSPSETVQLDKNKILAFVTVHGSVNSHTAILARMMNIPALVGVAMPLESLQNGTKAIVDGFHDRVILDPDDAEIQYAKQRIAEEKEKMRLLETLKGKKNRTLDGKEILLYANIGSLGDMAYAMDNDAGGIGLFRSEFFYLGRSTFPSEAEQFQVYRQAAQMMAGKRIIIRTLDIGADKQAEYFGLDKEENPALGYRAIRICLTRRDIFKTQLRALFQAAAFGEISVMYPMITSVSEILQIKAIAEEVRRELEQEGLPFRTPEQGIMIETPAAALISDDLAELVDYFSIGTNDLTQYTLAIDRQNPKLDAFFDAHHKAVLRLIQMTTENAHAKGKWVGICGMLGADLSMTETFLRMGIDELSVEPSMILKVRNKIRQLDLSRPTGENSC